MTGKQLWQALEAREREKVDLLDGASDAELRRALGYGLERPSQQDAVHRVMIRRALRRRGAVIPPALAAP